jgi:hypothetical protein
MKQPKVWVAVLNISWRTAEKISQLHQLTCDEVRDAVVCRSGLPYVWDIDPDRGARAIVKIQIRGRPALIVLYPTDDSSGDVWNLGSAYFVDI